MKEKDTQIIVLGATPGGISAALAAARRGINVLLLERSQHVGGLPANGLGATDIDTRDISGGIFLEFVQSVKRHYIVNYGLDSSQVRDCSDGYRFEPHVAETVFLNMLSSCPNITIRLGQELDPYRQDAACYINTMWHIQITDTASGETSTYSANILIDATYEGDLLEVTQAAYRLGREGISDYGEPFAGEIYMGWKKERLLASSGKGDKTIQAYNYRLCITKNPENSVTVTKPQDYHPEEYKVFLDDILENRFTGIPTDERYLDGIGRCLNLVPLPNGKYDANNQHLAFQSTDLPEENWPWPTSTWAWRDAFAERLKSYTLGLIWFAQNDPRLPAAFREACAAWGLAKDEYLDNKHFPRQVYVREGRRLVGTYTFTAFDSWRADGQCVDEHENSITASHYSLDSHAVRKYQPGYPHLEGFFNVHNLPYTVPYGVMLPKTVKGLIAPVPVSSTHLGFSTLRMEPCWLSLGQAAGLAAYLAISKRTELNNINIDDLQNLLREEGAVIYPSEINRKQSEAHDSEKHSGYNDKAGAAS